MFIVVAERAVGVKPTIVPNYVTETGYTEDIAARSNVGDTQDRRLLAVLNIKTGKTTWADGSFAPAPPEAAEEKPAPSANTPVADSRPARRAERDIRWSMPTVSGDGRFVVASARSADNKDRWHVVLDAESGKTRVVDLLHDDAWVRKAGGGAGFGGAAVEFLPDNTRIWFLSERDGWMHLYTLDVSNGAAKPVQPLPRPLPRPLPTDSTEARARRQTASAHVPASTNPDMPRTGSRAEAGGLVMAGRQRPTAEVSGHSGADPVPSCGPRRGTPGFQLRAVHPAVTSGLDESGRGSGSENESESGSGAWKRGDPRKPIRTDYLFAGESASFPHIFLISFCRGGTTLSGRAFEAGRARHGRNETATEGRWQRSGRT